MLPKNDTPSYMKYVPFPYLKHIAILAFVLILGCVLLGSTGLSTQTYEVVSHKNFSSLLLLTYGVGSFLIIISTLFIKNPKMDHFFSSAWAPFSVLIPIFFMVPRNDGASIFQKLLLGALNMGAHLG